MKNYDMELMTVFYQNGKEKDAIIKLLKDEPTALIDDITKIRITFLIVNRPECIFNIAYRLGQIREQTK